MGLLKGIDPLLSADLLHILRAAGHGDMICICDCNFPAATIATHTTTKKHVQMGYVTLPRAVKAVCSLLPLDNFSECQAITMYAEDGKMP